MLKRYYALILVIIVTTFLYAIEPSFAGDPAISPDGSLVCFVYDRDLWIVPFSGGVPRRITNTPSSEWNPLWSPDGKLIAFASDRESDSYLYFMPSEGGVAKVLIRENMALSDWYSDSKYILGNKYNLQWGRSFYKVPLDGNRPELIAEIGARYATLSPDNKRIIYQDGGYTYRKSYQGSANGELWSLDIAAKKYTKLTDTPLSELYPRFSHSSNSLFFCGSDGENLQLFKADKLNFKKPKQLSNFTQFSARDIAVARENERIVFEVFDTLYKYDPNQPNKITKLNIELSQDDWQDTLVRGNMKNSLDRYAVSSDELLVGFNYKYDSFFMPLKGGEAKQITFDHSGAFNMQFLDNRSMVFTRLDNGISKLFTAKADTLIKVEPVSWFGADSLNVEDFYRDDEGRWTILYGDYFRNNKLALADSGLVNIRNVETRYAVTTNFAINKQGTHAVYATMRDDSYIRELFLYEMESGKSRKLLSDDAWLGSIFWTPDNKSVLLSRNRSIYRLDLVPRDEFELDKDNWKEILSPPKKDEPETKEEQQEPKIDENGDSILMDIVIEEAKPDTTIVKTEVVWEEIDKRYFPVIESSFEYLNVMNMVSDSTFLYLEDATLSAKNTTLKKANIYGKNIKEEFSFGKESSFHTWVNDTVYYLDAGKLKSYNSATSTRKEVTAELDYQYDKALLNQRVFEQAWGAFGSNFYDPDMHGKSWKKLYEFYRPYVDKARSINDIAEIINEMIGDVNASHTGFYPRVEGIRRSIPIAFLGVELDLANVLPEGVKVSIVYPTSRLGSFYKLKEGDLISHINEIKITASTPLDSLLAGKIGKKISLRLVKDGIVSDAVITGLSYSEAYNLWYKYFTNANRLKVELLSDSKLGYIHIPSMGNTDWSNFYTELFRDNYDKDALVIDVRGNTGGYIHDQIISLLLKKRYAYSKSRSLSHNLRYEPRRSWDKPTIVLVNEESFSDGEIFPTIYQELKLGKVVGTPSSGAVIGTWHYYLMDGSSMRMPGTGWYKLDGSNMEGSGAMPDIIVDNSPEDKIARRDPQLERAVNELLKELK